MSKRIDLPVLTARFDEFYARWKLRLEKDVREAGSGRFSDPNLDEWSRLIIEARDLVAAIFEHSASSIDDLVLQARACAMQNNEFWVDPLSVENMHVSNITLRLLVEGICRLGNVPAFPGLEPLPMPAIREVAA